MQRELLSIFRPHSETEFSEDRGITLMVRNRVNYNYLLASSPFQGKHVKVETCNDSGSKTTEGVKKYLYPDTVRVTVISK